MFKEEYFMTERHDGGVFPIGKSVVDYGAYGVLANLPEDQREEIVTASTDAVERIPRYVDQDREELEAQAANSRLLSGERLKGKVDALLLAGLAMNGGWFDRDALKELAATQHMTLAGPEGLRAYLKNMSLTEPSLVRLTDDKSAYALTEGGVSIIENCLGPETISEYYLAIFQMKLLPFSTRSDAGKLLRFLNEYTSRTSDEIATVYLPAVQQAILDDPREMKRVGLRLRDSYSLAENVLVLHGLAEVADNNRIGITGSGRHFAKLVRKVYSFKPGLQ